MRVRNLLAATSAILSIPVVLANASSERGRDVFWQLCISCHAMGCNRDDSAPMLKGVVGRKAGTVAGILQYSDALKNSGISWTEEALDKFLADPPAMIPGIRQMTRKDIGIVTDAQQRKDLIAFIKTGDTSLDICPK